MKRFIVFLPILFILSVWLIFSSPFFLKGLVPYPSLFQSNFFAPWSSYGIYEGPVKNNAMPDIITQIYPWRVFSVESLKQGEIPLWNPFNFSGTPHLANFQSAPLFPLNIIFFLPVDFITSWSLLVLAQPLLAALGMYLFIRSLKISNYGAVLSAISFMFCGFLVTWMAYATLGYAILFLPFAFWGVTRFIETKKNIYGLVISFSIVLSIFSGHFQTSVYFLGALIAYILFESFRNKDRRKFAILILFYISGVLISMPQILPSFEFYLNSVRQSIVTQLEVIPLGYLPTLFAPDFFGNPTTRNDWFGHYAEWNGYAGVIPLLFAIFASFYFLLKDKRILFFFVLGIFSILMAFNTPVNSLFFELKLPFFSTSASSRIIVLFSFSVAVLSAFGFDLFIKKTKEISIKKLIVFLGISLGILIILWTIPFFRILEDSEKNFIAQNNLVLPTLIFLAFTGLLFSIFIFKKNKLFLTLCIFGILIITTLDMLRFATKWMPFDPKELVFKDVGVTNFYKENETNLRYLGEFSAENSVYYRIQALGGYDPLYPKRYGEFVKYIELGIIADGERSIVKFPYRSENVDKAINLLGAGYVPQKKSDDNQPWGFPFDDYPVDRFNVVYEDDVYRVFRNHQAFPRAFVADNYLVIDSDKKILDSMFDEEVNLQSTVILEKNPGIESSSSDSSEITIVNYKNNSVEIDIDSEREALLVLTDNYYPGWKAYVNDKESEIYRADYTLRAVSIPEGRSKVRFVYEPESFRYGIYLAVIGLVIILSVFVYIKRNERKN